MTPDAAAIRPSRVGQSLEGGYSLEERIGAGSLGETYRAKHVEHQRVVVVKLLHDDVSGDALRRSRFAWEAATLGGLSHPNVPALLDYGVHAGRRYLVREWMEGESLERRLARGPMPLDAALVIIRQLLAALAAVHSTRLLHRNLRPSNLFLEKRKQGRERLKLLDFAPAGKGQHAIESAFTPPEALAGELLDARSDVFAVGAILTAMLRGTGTLEPRVRVLTPVDLNAEPAADAAASATERSEARAPQPEATESQALRAVPPLAENAAARPSELPAGAAPAPQTFPLGQLPDDRGRARLGPDSALQRWLRRALSPDRNRRFADAAEMLQELIDLLPRELRSPGEDQAAAARPPSAASPLAAAPAPASPPLIAEPPSSAAMSWLAPAPAVKLPEIARLPSAEARVLPAPLAEAPPVALPQTRGEPGLTQLTAAAMIGAFLLAVVLIFVQPGEFGRSSRGSLQTATAADVQPAADARPRVEQQARVQTETKLAAAKRPPAMIPASATEVVTPAGPNADVALAASKVAAAGKQAAANSAAYAAGRNPWLQPLPAELEGLPGLVASGAIGDESVVARLRTYIYSNPNDPRGSLLLGKLYLNRLWRTDGIAQFARALQLDPSVRAAPEVLPALLEVVALGKATSAAEDLIIKVYGSDAVPVIDRQLENVTSPAAVQRLSALSARLLTR